MGGARSQMQANLRRLAKEHSSTPRLAAAVGVGAFVGATPFFGFHAVIGAALSRVLNLNVVAVLLGTQVSLPVFAPFLVFTSVQFGHWLLEGRWLDLGVEALDLEVAGRFFSAWLLGACLVGAALGAMLSGASALVLSLVRAGDDGESRWTGRSRGSGFGYELYFLVLRLLGRRFAYFVLGFVTVYFYLFARAGRRASQDFFRRVRGPTSFWQREKDTWRHFSTFAKLLSDRLEVLDQGKAAFESGYTDFHNLTDALAEGDGVILLSAHFGSWGIAGAQLAGHARPNVVVFDNEAESIRRFYARHPERTPPKLIVQSEGPTASMEILRALRSGEIVAMLADRVVPGGASVRVPFFGQDILLPVGPFSLAVVSGAPIAITFGHKAGFGRHEFVVLPARRFVAKRRADREALVEEGARWFAAALEAEARAHPHQWLNFYLYWASAAEQPDQSREAPREAAA